MSIAPLTAVAKAPDANLAPPTLANRVIFVAAPTPRPRITSRTFADTNVAVGMYPDQVGRVRRGPERRGGLGKDCGVSTHLTLPIGGEFRDVAVTRLV